jgi:YfiH family protein
VTLVLRSELLDRHGFRHGFSLRTGGHSDGPFASLNLGRAVGDDPDAVARNVERFAEAVGVRAERLYEVSQVHGRTVRLVDHGEDVLAVRHTEADAVVVRAADHGVGVRTADCIPILIGDLETGAVAAVHAGWRGVVDRVLDAALDALGTDPGRLVCAIGPHIRAASFEVGDDVARAIAEAAHGEDVVFPGDPRPHVDLGRAVRAQLRARGVDAAHVDDVGGCTYADAARFFSHRRDAGRTGRHLSVIVARG